MSESSFRRPIPRLQPSHNRPRTLFLLWSWSTQRRLGIPPQMAQCPPESCTIFSHWSSVSPYFRRSSAFHSISRRFPGCSRFHFNSAARFFSGFRFAQFVIPLCAHLLQWELYPQGLRREILAREVWKKTNNFHSPHLVQRRSLTRGRGPRRTRTPGHSCGA